MREPPLWALTLHSDDRTARQQCDQTTHDTTDNESDTV
jgi:hypothetical protein